MKNSQTNTHSSTTPVRCRFLLCVLYAMCALCESCLASKLIVPFSRLRTYFDILDLIRSLVYSHGYLWVQFLCLVDTNSMFTVLETRSGVQDIGGFTSLGQFSASLRESVCVHCTDYAFDRSSSCSALLPCFRFQWNVTELPNTAHSS